MLFRSTGPLEGTSIEPRNADSGTRNLRRSNITFYTRAFWVSALAAIVFLTLGLHFAALFWVFDGSTFFITAGVITQFFAFEKNLECGLKLSDFQVVLVRFRALVPLYLAALAVLQVSLCIFAISHFNEVMPFGVRNDGTYARKGNSFVFCSIFSFLCNGYMSVQFWRRNLVKKDAIVIDTF